MKKISEMNLEELQDYALDLEEKNKTLDERCVEYEREKGVLIGLNQQLQTRNNNLLMKVEQQGAGENAPQQPAEEVAESCEDFAKNLIKEGKF